MNVLGKIWGIYCIIMFVLQQFLMMLIVVPVLLLFKGYKTERFLLKVFFSTSAKFLLLFFGIRNRTSNFNVLNPNQNYIVIANHTTAIDILINASAMNWRPFKFLAKAELLRVPFLGPNVRRLCIPVDRSDAEARSDSFKKMTECLEQGMDVLIYPEGTRNTSPELLKEFYAGAFKLSVQTQTPIAICAVKRAKRLNDPKKGIWIIPGRVESVWLEPIYPNGLTIEQLKAESKQTMLEALQD